MNRKPYSEYKESGVEWLGQVPGHWEVKAIKWESLVPRGASPRPIDDPIYFDDEGEFAWVRISDVTAAGMYLENTEQQLSELGSSLSVKMQPGSLFLSIAGSVGKPCIAKIKCCIHDGFVYFPRWKGDPRFLYYIFASGEPYKGLGKMGTQLNLNTDTVGGISIGLPDEEEQTAIADFLDRETGRIDTLVAKKRRLIALLGEKRTALISRTVTRGLPAEAAREFDLEPHTRFKDSGIGWLGEVPEGWKPTRLKFIADIQTGYAFSSDDFTDEGVPVLRIGDITKDGSVDFANAKYLPENHKTVYSKVLITRGAIVMAMTGATIGKAGKYDQDAPALLNQRVCSFYSTGDNDHNFLWYILNADFYMEHINLTAFGGAQPNISDTELLDCFVAVAPATEQAAIATYLDRETAKIDRLMEKIETAIARLQEYRTALITAAVTGKIDVREEVA